MMIAVGLYVTGSASWLRALEGLGKPLWDRIKPLAQRFIPVRSPRQALVLGLLWGWLPCGLVYAALATALTSGSTAAGAATLLAFGLGTLPMLLVMGSAAALVARAARARRIRAVAGVALLAFGAVQLAHVSRVWNTRSPAHACCPKHPAKA
jgi:sulfite exporter TauE/SafE